MSSLAIITEHRAARNAASIALADAGPGPASIKLYTAEGGTLLATRTLAKPCGVITAEGRIALQGAAVQDLVAASGAVAWATWCDGSGAPIAAGAVTDEAGAGPFKLRGATGTNVYEGGVVALDSTALLG